jgi:hypothetical protein
MSSTIEVNKNYYDLRLYLNITRNIRSIITIILVLLVEHNAFNHFWQRMHQRLMSVCLSVCLHSYDMM